MEEEHYNHPRIKGGQDEMIVNFIFLVFHLINILPLLLD